MIRKQPPKGFTLIEMIASLLLMGIIGAIAGLGMVQIIDGFLFSKDNAETVQKSQLVMARLAKEFQNITSISAIPAPSGLSLTYSRNRLDPTDTHTLSYDPAADTLKLDGDLLISEVSRFQLRYYPHYYHNTTNHSGEYSPECRIIEIQLELSGAGGTVVNFENRLFLRELVTP